MRSYMMLKKICSYDPLVSFSVEHILEEEADYGAAQGVNSNIWEARALSFAESLSTVRL